MAYELNKTYVLYSHAGAGRCLTVYGGTANKNQNVCIFRKTGTSAQNWTIKAFGANYKIVTGVNQTYALNYYWTSGKGNPGNCDIYPQSGNDADSSVILESVASDVFRIKLKNYDLYLTAKGSGDSVDVRWEKEAVLDPKNDPYENARAPQLWRLVDPTAKGIRAPFIYAGKNRDGDLYRYDETQLKGLDNATEFVVTAGPYQHYFKATGEPTSDVQEYITEAVARTKILYNKYGKQVWIGTPAVGEPPIVPHTETVYGEIGKRMRYFIDNLITRFGGTAQFNTYVKGFYISDEGIHDLDSSMPSTTPIEDYPQVKMFKTVSDYAAAKGKKMLWSPHWGGTNLVRAAHVIHKTAIFDIALIQPGYYFNAAYNYQKNCDAVRMMIQTQRMRYQQGMPIVHENDIKCFRTKIGCQMEIDTRGKNQPYSDRYQYYVDTFKDPEKELLEGSYRKAEANFGHYFGYPAEGSAGYDAAKEKVDAFFAL